MWHFNDEFLITSRSLRHALAGRLQNIQQIPGTVLLLVVTRTVLVYRHETRLENVLRTYVDNHT